MQDSALFNGVKTEIPVSLQNDALKCFILVAILPDRISCPVHDMHTTCTNAIFLHTCFEKTAATLPNESMWRGISGFHLRYLLLVQRMRGRSGTALLTSVAVPTMCQNVPLLLQKSLFHWQLTKIIQDRQLFGLAWMHSENLWIEVYQLFWYSCICSFFLVHTEGTTAFDKVCT